MPDFDIAFISRIDKFKGQMRLAVVFQGYCNFAHIDILAHVRKVLKISAKNFLSCEIGGGGKFWKSFGKWEKVHAVVPVSGAP
jgi:hypothetical protein